MGSYRLSGRERAFCEQYLLTLNATRAYMSVYGTGYDTAGAAASRLLSKEKIQQELARQRAARAALPVTAQDIVQQCLRVLGADVTDYFEQGTDGRWTLKADLTQCDTSVIQELNVSGTGGARVKLMSKDAAMKLLKEIIIGSQVTVNTPGAPCASVYQSVMDGLTLDELRALAAAGRAAAGDC